MAWWAGKEKAQGIAFGVEAHVGSLAPEPKQAEKLVPDVPGFWGT